MSTRVPPLPPDGSTPRGPAPRGSTPPTVRRAAGLVAVEAVALGLLGAAYAVASVLGTPTEQVGAVVEGVLALVVAALLLAVARGLAAGRGWAWAPAITAQLFWLVVGAYLLQAGVWAVALPVLLLPVAVLAHLASPGARASYGEGERRQG